MYNILICDDERDIVAALKIYLEAEGYTTFTASDGREALDTARAMGKRSVTYIPNGISVIVKE